MLTVAEYQQIEELGPFRRVWRDLLEQTRQASFVQSFDWLSNYWRHFGHDQVLRTLVVSVGERPIGVVPLVVKSAQSRLGTVRVLTYPLDGLGTVYGPIGPNPAAALHAALRHIQESPRDWDLIDLRDVNADGPDRKRTRNAMRSAGFQAYCRTWREIAAVELPTRWSEYLAHRPASVHRDLEFAEARLAQQGTLRYVRYRPAGTASGETDRRWELYRAMETVAGYMEPEHWTEFCGQPGARPAELFPARSTDYDGSRRVAGRIRRNVPLQLRRMVPERAFRRDLHVAAVDAGTADLNVLFAGSQPVACAYNFCTAGRIESTRFAAAGDHRREAGTVLLARMLQDSISRGDHRVALHGVPTELASAWQTSILRTCRYSHFALAAPRAQAMRLSHCAQHWLGLAKSPRQNNRPHSAFNPPTSQLTIMG